MQSSQETVFKLYGNEKIWKVQITPFIYRESSDNPLKYVLVQFTP
jgi:hypothetical protein